MQYDAPTDSAVYKTLLESTRAIPWKIDWKTMTFAYIGPQIEALLGWSQSSWVSANDWAERMHPEDRERVVGFCVSQSREGTDHEADYRALSAAGDYVWIRDVVHVVRDDNGEVESLVGFMFDISERKRAEEQLIMLQRQLEEYSYKDGLTGVANRRMFDTVMDAEWHNARRNYQPLSLVMLDIDYFKQYNDHYGHVQGDDCLRSVGKALAGALHRPRDFIARFGGEEFVLVLPGTSPGGARLLAEKLRRSVEDLGIAHELPHPGAPLTISIGVATATPQAGQPYRQLIEMADEALYNAKHGGRNQVGIAG